MSNARITTVLAVASTYDLTDLPTVKDELSITNDESADDRFLSRAITQVSRAVSNDTNRVFAPESVQDVFDIAVMRSQVPSGVQVLQLSRWPIIAVASVVQTEDGTPTTLTENTDFRVDADNGELLRLSSDTGRVIAWEPMQTTVIYAAGFGAAVAEAHTVPGTPYQVTISETATFSCDRSLAYANGTALARVAASPAHGQYTVTSAGLYTFNAADTAQSLTFAYCIRDIPDDLIDATLRLVTARFKARGRDPMMIEDSTQGTRRYWFGSAPGQTGPFPPDIEAMLDNYKVPVVA